VVGDRLSGLYLSDLGHQDFERVGPAYLEIWSAIRIFGVVVSCNASIVDQKMDSFRLLGLYFLDQFHDLIFLGDISRKTENTSTYNDLSS